MRQIINEQDLALREIINGSIIIVDETLSKIVDDYEVEIRQQITEIKVGLEKTNETIIQLRVEVETKITQIGNHNDIRITEIQAKTHEKLDEIPINVTGRIERVHNEMKMMKIRQMSKRKNTREEVDLSLIHI